MSAPSMIPSIEIEVAFRSMMPRAMLTPSDLAAAVARRRVEAGRDAVEAEALRAACKRWLHRNFGQPTDAEVEADIAERLAEAEKIGPEAVAALAEELRAEAARFKAHADALKDYVARRDGAAP